MFGWLYHQILIPLPINPYFIAIWQSSYILEENHESAFKIEIIIIHTLLTIQSPVFSHIKIYLELWYVWRLIYQFHSRIESTKYLRVLASQFKELFTDFLLSCYDSYHTKSWPEKKSTATATGYWKEAESNILDLQNTPLIFTRYINFIIFSFILIYHMHNNGQQSVLDYWNILCEHYTKQIYKKYITPLCKNVLPDKSKTMCVPYILKRWTEFNSGHGDVCTLN